MLPSVIPLSIFTDTSIPTFEPSIAPSVNAMVTPSVTPTLTPTLVTTSPSSMVPTLINNTATTSFVLLGCYADKIGLRAMSSRISSSVSSIVSCYTLAVLKSYKYFSLQTGSECWGSNNLTAAIKYGQCISGVPSRGQLKYCHCNKPCGNIGPDICGGGWANQIYAISKSSSSFNTNISRILTSTMMS